MKHEPCLILTMDHQSSLQSVGIPKTPRGQRTLVALLRSAENIFAERGFHGASISEITQGAGLGAGTFYIYFTDKNALFRALVDKLQNELRAYLRQANSESRNRLECERNGLRAFLEFARARPKLFRILQESYLVDPEIYFSYFETIADSYAARLAEAQQSGEIAKGDPLVQAWCLIGLSNFLGMRYSLPDAKGVSLNDILSTAASLIEQGLAPRASTASERGGSQSNESSSERRKNIKAKSSISSARKR